MGDNLTNWIERKKKLDVWEILRQITKLVDNIHTQNVHGKLTPSTVILDSTGENVKFISASTTLEDLKEWRPTEEKENEPSKEGDIFSLGCLFYFVLSSGQHPFGKSGQRVQLIANHLYDLSWCKNVQLHKLLASMISYDSSKRPSCTELLNEPFLWEKERIINYLNAKSNDFEKDSRLKKLWTETILLSTKDQSVSPHVEKSYSVVRSVAEILKLIKENEENPVKLSRKFPDLLLTVFSSTEDKTQENEKESNQKAHCPEIINNLLITNESFGKVEPTLPSIQRRHGRFGMNHVHVVKLHSSGDTNLLKRIRQLTHPNLLKFFYLTENCFQTYMAFEPFNETLETWTKQSKNFKSDFKVVIEILCQITNGLGYYHSNKLIHGNLTADQVIIFDNGDSITAKMAKFTFPESSVTILDDVRNLGQIYEDLLSQTEKTQMQEYVTQHIILAMKNQKDEFVPPYDAIFFHPLFWNPEDIIEFILLTGETCAEDEENENSSKLIECLQSTEVLNILNQLSQHTKTTSKTNRDLIQGLSAMFNANEMDKAALTEIAMLSTRQFPKSVLLTWLCLQELKENEYSSSIDSFYPRNYKFPTVEQLTCDLSKCVKTENNISIAAKEQTSDENFQTTLVDTKSDVSVFEPLTSYFEKFVQPQELIIKSYLEQCIQRLKTNQVQLSKALPVDDYGRTVLHLASYSNNFCDFAAIFIDRGANVDARDKSGSAPLHIATWHNADLIVKLLIKNQATVDIPDQQFEKTPLYFAVAIKSMTIVKLLWKKITGGTKVNSFGQTALHIAVANDSLDIAEYLVLQKGFNVNHLDKDGYNPLCIAVVKDSLEMVKMLLQHGANPNLGMRRLLHIAVSKASYPMVEFLLNRGVGLDPTLIDLQGLTALHVAAFSPRTPSRREIVDLLIKSKVNPDLTDNAGQTALHIAILSQAEDVVSRLLECPNINVEQREHHRKMTPLHLAALGKSDNITKMLIDKNANVDARDKNGETPLEYAAAVDAVDVAIRLLEAGANAKSKRWNSRSPLHIAAAHGSLEVGKLLISKGADVNAVDKFNFTPLHYAMFREKMDFVELLKSNQKLAKSKVSATALPPVSKKLCPDDMSLIPTLTNGIVINTPFQMHIQLPQIVTQFTKFKLEVTQKLNIQIPSNAHVRPSFTKSYYLGKFTKVVEITWEIIY